MVMWQFSKGGICVRTSSKGYQWRSSLNGQKDLFSPTLCIHFTWQWVSFTSWWCLGRLRGHTPQVTISPHSLDCVIVLLLVCGVWDHLCDYVILKLNHCVFLAITLQIPCCRAHAALWTNVHLFAWKFLHLYLWYPHQYQYGRQLHNACNNGCRGSEMSTHNSGPDRRPCLS